MKKLVTKLSLVAALAIIPSTINAASGSAAVEGSSESSSALVEGANVEQQINRINTGIAFVRLNTVLLKEMPISGDSVWVDEVTKNMTPQIYKKIRASDTVKNDSYLSTALITNVILKRPAVDLTPLNGRLYLQLMTIYKNKDNALKNNITAYDKYSVPNIYALPSFEDMNTFTNFSQESYGKKVEKINVNAAQYELYENVELAAISLAPKKYQTKLLDARKGFIDAVNDVALIKGQIKLNEARLNDDKNIKDSNRAKWSQDIELNKQKLVEAEAALDIVDEEFKLLIEEASLEIESNIQDDFETVKVPLAKKLEKLLDLVDNNAIGAGTMFASASAHLMKNGVGTLEDELKALTIAQAATTLVGNQKLFIIDRIKRMGTGALMALPNIAIGSYYAIKQSLEAGKYQTIVNKVLEINEANQEALEAKKNEEAPKQEI